MLELAWCSKARLCWILNYLLSKCLNLLDVVRHSIAGYWSSPGLLYCHPQEILNQQQCLLSHEWHFPNHKPDMTDAKAKCRHSYIHTFIIIFKLSVIDLQIQYYELTLSARQSYRICKCAAIFPQQIKDDMLSSFIYATRQLNMPAHLGIGHPVLSYFVQLLVLVIQAQLQQLPPITTIAKWI